MGEELKKKVVKSRVAAKGWVTRATHKLEELVAADPVVGKLELEDAMDDFDKRLAALDAAQEAVEVELDSPELELDIEGAADYRDKVRRSRLAAAKKLIEIDKQKDKQEIDVGSVSVAGSQGLKTVKLPRLELPKFSGKLTDWQTFWDQFVATVHESELPSISKFSYLQSLLEGEAKSVIHGLSMTHKHYNDACALLQERYGRKERIIFAHIQALLNITSPPPQAKGSRVTGLWKLQDELQSHIRSLEALGVKGDEYGLFLTPVILSRLPQDIRLEWARDGEGHESDLDFLLKFLQKEIQRRERSETFKENQPPPAVKAQVDERRGKVATVAALQTSSEVVCGFCDKQHPTQKCWEVTKLGIPERRERIRSAGLCFRCLLKGHIAKGCSAKCSKCSGRHHALVCTGTYQNASSNDGRDTGVNSSFRNYYDGRDTGVNSSFRNYYDRNDPGVSSSFRKDPGASSNFRKDTGVSPSFRQDTCVNPSFKEETPVLQVSCWEQKKATILQTARVKVQGRKGLIEATVLFDSGSDRSYVSATLARKVEPEWVSSQHVSYVAFGTGKAKKDLRNIYRLNLRGMHGGNETLLAVEVPLICTPMYRAQVPNNLVNAFGNIEFADDYTTSGQVSVDILIGLDFYWKFIQQGMIRLPDGLVAQETLLGWVVSGSWPSSSQSPYSVVSHPLLCFNDVPEVSLRQFWDLESIGIAGTGVQEPSTTDYVLQQFNESVCFVDGRYEVVLPWKDHVIRDKLLNNEKLARCRLNGLSRNLAKNPSLHHRYNEALKEMEMNGVIIEVPKEELVSPYPTYYMPHRPVVRESSSSTKVRPVFDASATGYNNISLNDCLEVGPSLIPNLPEILIRFRRWRVALTADITKAFLQIKICRPDQDVHRFLWDLEGTIRTMRFERVPFGNRSSPFLLNATIQHHLAKFTSTRVIEELKKNLYVDDWLSGANDEVEAWQMFTEAKGVMQKASMSLAKWSTNSEQVSDMIYKEVEAKHLESESVKVLGMKWIASKDCFSFGGVEIPTGLKITKRVVLSLIARLFDPLGLLTPFIMLAKIIFQELWKLGVGWDEEVPENLHVQFSQWVNGLAQLQHWHVPRCYTSILWNSEGIELHAFSDASEKGYGACIYLRASNDNGQFSVALVVSKARVAPVKRITLPRLELLGALLCARLLGFARKALELSDNVKYQCWTDSMVVLGWVKGDPNKWKVFVSNRVSEIQELTSPACWSHCSGKDNPADLVTRGVLAPELMSSKLWLQGPEWLSSRGLHEVHVKVAEVDNGEEVVIDSMGPGDTSNQTSLVALDRECNQIVEVERWGKFCKALRVLGWVLRFIGNAKARMGNTVRETGDLSFNELCIAKVELFRCVQKEYYPAERTALIQGQFISKNSAIASLNPFLDEKGLLRVKSRLGFSDLAYEEKYPIILPNSHVSLLLVRFQHCLLKHAGVNTLISSIRSSYWIVGLRKLAKRVKKECVACLRQDAKACSQPMAPLPKLRAKKAPPFGVTGVDYAGPVYCLDFPSKKFYILLFTCAVVRAIHLELVESLSLPDFLMALRRFSARRGLPSVIYSDNAKTFVGAQVHLQRYFGHLSPVWKFIAPRSPWWGGWWERLVRTIKSALKKSIGTRSIIRSELETSLHEVESCVNSRPLTFAGDDLDSGIPLTPSHFLIGRCAGVQLNTAGDYEHTTVTAQDLSDRELSRQQLLHRFWSLWSSDYLRNLPPLQGSVSRGNLQKGSVVLIREDGSPRLRWPLGVVTKTFPGRDGIIRAVELKTSKGTFTRAIQLLHKMEILDQDDQLEFKEHLSSVAPLSEVVPADETGMLPSSEATIPLPEVAKQFPDITGNFGDPKNSVVAQDAQCRVSRFGRSIKPIVKMNL